MARPANRVLSAMLQGVWALPQPVLEEMIAIAERHNESVEAVAERLGRPLQNTQSMTVRGPVAILPISGPIFRYANLFTDISGATAVEILGLDLRTALEDPAVRSIVLEVDSPGGEVNGIAEFAGMVRAANAVKPVTAYVGGIGASAAYWIAAAAGRVVIGSTGMVGSIGVVSSLVDDSKDTDMRGRRVVRFVSSQSPNKRPDLDSEAGRSTVQAVVDRIAAQFIGEVAAFRGVTTDKVISDFGGGSVKIGADAVAAGMADAVGTFEGVVSESAAAGSQPGAIANAAAAALTEGQETMNTEANKDAPAAETPEQIAARNIEAGRQQERARLADLRSASLPGFESLLAECEADGKSTGADLARKIVAAQKAAGTNFLANRAADATATGDKLPPPKASQGGEGGDRFGPAAGVASDIGEDPAALEKLWNSNAAERAAFNNNKADFEGYYKALAAGAIGQYVAPKAA